MIPSRAKRRRRRGRLASGDLSGADYPFFHPFFFATRDERNRRKKEENTTNSSLFILERSLSSRGQREKGRAGEPWRPHRRRSRSPVTWIHPESNLLATQTRWLNALICTRLCDRDGKGRGGEVYMYIDASDGERFGR